MTVNVEFVDHGSGQPEMHEVKGSERDWPADLVLLALGFTGPGTGAIASELDPALDDRKNFATDRNFMTNRPAVFAAGDARRGQSLIVWAISEGREAARTVDLYLMGHSLLPSKECCDLPQSRNISVAGSTIKSLQISR